MSYAGLGVLINRLGGDDESYKIVQGAIGKQIDGLEIVVGDRGYPPDKLCVRLVDGTGFALYDDGQSCCELRYMHTDDRMEDFVGAEFLGAEVREGEETVAEYGDCKESEFLIIKTSLGEFTVVNYNEHNGYYGGFFIRAEELPPLVW